MTTMTVTPIGVIHSPHTRPERTPIQPVFATGCRGWADIDPQYAEGLADLEGFSHLWLIYWFDRAKPAQLTVTPFMDTTPRGLFATRAPARPNPLGLSVVRLVGRDGCRLELDDVDMLDGTPLLDIKPYCPRFDLRADARAGWQEPIDDATAHRRGARHL